MRVIKPIEITSSNMNSTIQEPDPLLGEVEWFFGSDIGTITGASSSDTYYSSVVIGDSVYSVGDAGHVLETNTLTQSLSTFGAHTGVYNAIALGADGFAYAVGGTGLILKIDAELKTTSTFGAYTGIYNAMVSNEAGFLYCIGSTGSALKINIKNQSVSLISASVGTYNTATINESGVMYCAGQTQVPILKIDTDDDAVSQLGSLDETFYGSCIGSDGDVYFAGDGAIGGVVMHVSAIDDAVDYFGRYSELIRSISLFDDGLIYGVGWSGAVLVIDTSNESVAAFGSFPYSYNTSSSVGGHIYCHGNSGLSLKFSSAGYFEGESSVIASSHGVYQASSFTTESPLIGIELNPPTWVKVSSTNKYRAFDYTINTKSTLQMPGGFFEFTHDSFCTNVGVFGLEGVTKVIVTVREDSDIGAIIYNSEIETEIPSPLGDSLVNDKFLSDKVIFDDLPIYATPYIKVEFESDDSTALVGDIAIGNSREMGVAQYQSSTSRTSYDTVTTDTFGNDIIVSRPSAEYTSYEVEVTPEYADYVERILKESLNQPRVWIGDKMNGEKLFTFGRYERSPIVYTSPTEFNTSIKIRGLV